MLEWTHANCGKADCTGTTECPHFPAAKDRIAMADAAYMAYAEADGTHFLDFVQDVCLLAIARGVEPATVRALLNKARRQYHQEN